MYWLITLPIWVVVVAKIYFKIQEYIKRKKFNGLQEGKWHKGGQNHSYQIAERPDPPVPMRPPGYTSYDVAMWSDPRWKRLREFDNDFQIIAEIHRLITEFFDGDIAKATLWMETDNPMFGYISPNDMIKLGKSKKVYAWVVDQLDENMPPEDIEQ